MAELAAPTARVRESFLTAMAEFQAEGRGSATDRTMVGWEIQDYRATWHTPEGFERYARWLRDQALEESPRAEGWVPCTTLWWVDGPEYLGRIAIRHRLSPSLREIGGHIGYDVRPTARRRGHATAMLRAVLPVAHRLGVDPALLTCDETNVGSRKAIESNGGVLDGRNGRTLRYWVATSTGNS